MPTETYHDLGMEIAALVGIVLFLLACIYSAVKESRRKAKAKAYRQMQIDHRRSIVEAERLKLDLERQRLRGTGKVLFVDWETSFLETHRIRFRRPSPPRARPTGWSIDWDESQLLRQEGCCYWCGSPLGGVAHRDHVQPLARGGLNDVSNLVMACPPCNLDKGAADPAAWILSTPRISDDRRLVVANIAGLKVPKDTNENHVNSDKQFAQDDPVEFELIHESLFEDSD